MGKRFANFDDKRNLYIERNLFRMDRCDVKCLNDRDLTFAIGGWTEERIKFLNADTIFKFGVDAFDGKRPGSGLRLFLLSKPDAESEFAEVLRAYPYGHRLRFDDDKQLVWRQSGDSLKELRKYMLDVKKEYRWEEIISNDCDKFVIVAADPGMGKSTFVDKLTDIPVNNDCFLWKVRIDLNTRMSFLRGTKITEINEDTVYNFIAGALGLNNYEIELFYHNYFNDGRIILLFDGFDEICPKYRDLVIQMFLVLKRSKIRKILITTRPLECENLEDKLCTFAYRLSPFSYEHIEEYLRLYMTANLKVERQDPIVEKDNARLIGFLENPLHLSMAAEHFASRLDRGQSRGLVETYNRLTFYELFTKRKFYDIYCEQKGYIQDEELRDDNFEDFVLVHKSIAIVELFGEDVLRQLKLNKLPNKTVKWNKAGFVVGGVMIHRTFAEYFAGLALHDSYLEDREQAVVLFTHVDLYSVHNEDIRYFFDLKFASAIDGGHPAVPINIAVLTHDVEVLADLASDGGVKCADAAGRTALHLAIGYGFGEACCILIHHDADVGATDNILGWTPLDYALNFGFKSVVHPIVLLNEIGSSCESSLKEATKWESTLSKLASTTAELAAFDRFKCNSTDIDFKQFYKTDGSRNNVNFHDRDHRSVNTQKNRDYFMPVWISTVLRMFAGNTVWKSIFVDMMLTGKQDPPTDNYVDEVIETLFTRAVFVHEALKRETVHDESVKIAVSDWTDEIYDVLPAEEPKIDLTRTNIDDIADLNRFRIFLLGDADPEREYNEVNRRLSKPEKMLWLKSKDFNVVHQDWEISLRALSDLKRSKVRVERTLREVLDDGDKISVMSNIFIGNNFPLCRSMVDLSAFAVEPIGVNEESVREYILKSLYLKRGRDIDVFHEYFADGRTMLLFEDLVDDDLNDRNRLNKLASIMQRRGALKLCVKTKSKIIIYNLIDQLVTDCVNISNCDEIPLRSFELLKLSVASNKLTPTTEFSKLAYALVNSLKPNTTIGLLLGGEFNFNTNADDQFLKIVLNWRTTANALLEDAYSFVHRSFVEECEAMCARLVEDPSGVMQLTKFPGKDKANHESAIRFTQVLRNERLGKIIVIGGQGVGPALGTFGASIQMSNGEVAKVLKDRLRGKLESFGPAKEQLMLETFAGYAMGYDMTPLTLDTLFDRLYELLEKYGDIQYGAELVLLFSRKLMSDHGPEWKGKTRLAFRFGPDKWYAR